MKQINALALLVGLLCGCAGPPLRPMLPPPAPAPQVDQLGPKRLAEPGPEPAAVYLGSVKTGREWGLRQDVICDFYRVGDEQRTRCYDPAQWPAHHEVPGREGSMRR